MQVVKRVRNELCNLYNLGMGQVVYPRHNQRGRRKEGSKKPKLLKQAGGSKLRFLQQKGSQSLIEKNKLSYAS